MALDLTGIDPTKPVRGNAKTSDIRANFAAIKHVLEDVDTALGAVGGGAVETVAGVSPTGGDVPRASLESALTGLATTSALAAKAPLASPALTGTPTAPTAAGGTNTTQLATTAFVRTEVAAIVDSAPGTLDTLNELAAALGDDANFATTTATALAGKAAGPASSTDNAVMRFDGTGGKTAQNSLLIIEDNGAIHGFIEHQITVSGTTYTIDAATVPSGSVLRFTSASAVAVTVANDLAVGWTVSWRQVGAGQVTFTAGAGAAVHNFSTHTKSAGQYAQGSLSCDSNAGAAAVLYLSGETAA
jgi:hypothetical protein